MPSPRASLSQGGAPRLPPMGPPPAGRVHSLHTAPAWATPPPMSHPVLGDPPGYLSLAPCSPQSSSSVPSPQLSVPSHWRPIHRQTRSFLQRKGRFGGHTNRAAAGGGDRRQSRNQPWGRAARHRGARESRPSEGAEPPPEPRLRPKPRPSPTPASAPSPTQAQPPPRPRSSAPTWEPLHPRASPHSSGFSSELSPQSSSPSHFHASGLHRVLLHWNSSRGQVRTGRNGEQKAEHEPALQAAGGRILSTPLAPQRDAQRAHEASRGAARLNPGLLIFCQQGGRAELPSLVFRGEEEAFLGKSI